VSVASCEPLESCWASCQLLTSFSWRGDVRQEFAMPSASDPSPLNITELQALLDPSRRLKLHTLELGAFASALGPLFAFAYVWSIGGNLAGASRAAFDTFARDQLAPVSAFPGQ
jgi:hypothetical protein